MWQNSAQLAFRTPKTHSMCHWRHSACIPGHIIVIVVDHMWIVTFSSSRNLTYQVHLTQLQVNRNYHHWKLNTSFENWIQLFDVELFSNLTWAVGLNTRSTFLQYSTLNDILCQVTSSNIEDPISIVYYSTWRVRSAYQKPPQWPVWSLWGRL